MNKELINHIINIAFVILVIGLVGFGLYNQHLNYQTQYSILFSDDPNYNQPDTDYRRAWEEQVSQCDENPGGSHRCAVWAPKTEIPSVVWGVEGGPKIEVKTKTIAEFLIKPEVLSERYSLFYKLVEIFSLGAILYFILDYFVFRFKKKRIIDHTLSVTGMAVLIAMPLLLSFALCSMLLFLTFEGRITYHAINVLSYGAYGIGVVTLTYYVYKKKWWEVAFSVPLGTLLLTLFLHFFD